MIHKLQSFFGKHAILHICLLLGVFSLTIFTRFWHLQDLPNGFHNDEAMNGYVGRYILENGFDPYGNKWPLLYFKNFGDYPHIIPMYFSGIFTYVFDITIFAVRFPIALIGVLTVVLVYICSRWLYKPPWVALVVSFIVAVMPWHIILSRATAEGITGSFVYILGIVFFYQALIKKSKTQLFISSLLLLLTYFLYQSYRIIVPLTILPTFLFIKEKKWKLSVFIMSLFFFALTITISQTVWGKGRYHQTSLFHYNNTLDGRSLNYSIGLGEGRILEARIFHNRLVLASQEFARQYISYFSPAFFTGGNILPIRYFVPEHGVWYWSFYIALALFISTHIIKPYNNKELSEKLFHKSNKTFFIWLLWIIAIVPIPAALTLEDVPNIHRTAVLGVLLAIAFGSVYFYLSQIAYKKIPALLIFLGLIMTAEFILFWHYYSNFHSKFTAQYRNYDTYEIYKYIRENNDLYTKIYVPEASDLSLHYLFHSKNFSPELITQFNSGLKVNSIENIEFTPGNCLPKEFATTETDYAIILPMSCPAPVGTERKDILKDFNLLDATGIYIPAEKL